MERYQRAIRLARQVEPKGDLPKTVLAHLEGRVRHYDGNDPQYFSLKALELLAEFRFGEFSALGEIAGRIAVSSRAAGDFERARGHYAVEARLWHRAGRQDKAEAALVSRAECFFEEAGRRERPETRP